MKIVTQEGSPVDVKDVEPTPQEDLADIIDDVEGAAKKLHKGVKKFSNSVIFKVGLVAVAIKAIDVVGKIILENQRLKSEERRQQDEE